jgi:cbb3-type cytochrome oxidase cytochrome c subunit
MPLSRDATNGESSLPDLEDNKADEWPTMAESKELRGLRQFLRRLECRQIRVKQGGVDVTSQQIAHLRREIERLERTFSRLSGKE